MDFQEFPKLPRLSREVIITEKLDGTNACVAIALTSPENEEDQGETVSVMFANEQGQSFKIWAGSRTQWITPEKDNYGFAGWVKRNAQELIKLGVGRHFGEWWGNGIQRRYDLKEKRFSLFNTLRWVDVHTHGQSELKDKEQFAPACCHVVPVLYRGIFDTTQVEQALAHLQHYGSVAAPNFPRPEGVVIYHIAGNIGFKKTIEKDEVPKGLIK